MLPNEAVLEFIELCRKNYGVNLDLEKATEYANRLYRFLKLITKPNENDAKNNWWFLSGLFLIKVIKDLGRGYTET